MRWKLDRDRPAHTKSSHRLILLLRVVPSQLNFSYTFDLFTFTGECDLIFYSPVGGLVIERDGRKGDAGEVAGNFSYSNM